MHSGERGGIPAVLILLEAILASSPAAGLVGVGWQLSEAQVTSDHYAVGRAKTFGLTRCRSLDAAAGLESGDSRTRNGILAKALAVDVEGKTRIFGRYMTRDGDSADGNLITTGFDVDLSTACIELRVILGSLGSVQGKDLWADEIVAAKNVLGKLDRDVAAVVIKFVNAPLASSLVVALVPDLEPAIAVARIVDGRVDLLHVHAARTLVRRVNGNLLGVVGPRPPFEGERVGGLDVEHAGYTLVALNV